MDGFAQQLPPARHVGLHKVPLDRYVGRWKRHQLAMFGRRNRLAKHLFRKFDGLETNVGSVASTSGTTRLPRFAVLKARRPARLRRRGAMVRMDA